MSITSVELENYKPFACPQKLELRPLTVLIGKNSSGKSALARLPLLIGRALSAEAEGPVDLYFDDLDFGGSFRDLVHGRVEHAAITMGASVKSADGVETTFRAKIQDISESKQQLVWRWEIADSAGYALNLALDKADAASETQVYTYSGNAKGSAPLRFHGLLPDGLNQELADSGLYGVNRQSAEAIEADAEDGRSRNSIRS